MRDSSTTNDPVKLALLAKRELKRDPRQAAEKAYLAAVLSARQIVRALGARLRDRSSASAIGRAAQLIGERFPGRVDLRKVTGAFQHALGNNKSCFYEGVCERGTVREDVEAVVRAVKTVRRVFGAT